MYASLLVPIRMPGCSVTFCGSQADQDRFTATTGFHGSRFKDAIESLSPEQQAFAKVGGAGVGWCAGLVGACGFPCYFCYCLARGWEGAIWSQGYPVLFHRFSAQAPSAD